MNTTIVIAFDRLPVRRMGCYGASPSPTPHLDRFASTGVVFDWHFAENTDAQAVNHAWWTGRFQFPRSASEQNEATPALFEALARQSVATTGLCEESSRWAQTTRRHWNTQQTVPASTGSHIVFRDAMQVLNQWQSSQAENRLLWVMSSGLTASQDPQSQANEQEMRRLDDSFGRFENALQASHKTTGGEMLTIVTAAEGTVDGDGPNAGLPDEFRRLADAVAHTPLMIRIGARQWGLRQPAPVQTVDLAPTLLEWFGVPREAFPLDGASLLPWLRLDADVTGRESLCIGNGRRCVAVRTRDFCLLTRPDFDSGDDADVRLFVKPDDPWEVHDVAGQESETIQRLQSELTAFLRGFQTSEIR